jgi:hypothetical protein
VLICTASQENASAPIRIAIPPSTNSRFVVSNDSDVAPGAPMRRQRSGVVPQRQHEFLVAEAADEQVEEGALVVQRLDLRARNDGAPSVAVPCAARRRDGRRQHVRHPLEALGDAGSQFGRKLNTGSAESGAPISRCEDLLISRRAARMCVRTTLRPSLLDIAAAMSAGSKRAPA